MQNLRGTELPRSLRLSPDRAAPSLVKTDLGRLASFVYACDELVSYFRITEKQVVEEEASWLRNYVSYLSSVYGFGKKSVRFVDKSQSYTLKVPLLRRAFPDAKFVVVTRNPYALVHSRSSGRHLDWAQQQSERTLSETELAVLRAEHWRNSFEIVLGDLDDSERYLIQFEKFLLEPQIELRRLLGFLELRDTGDLLPRSEHKMPLGSASGEKWFPMVNDPNTSALATVSRKKIKLIEKKLGDVALKLGYPCPR